MTTIRMKPEERKNEILKAALIVSTKKGYNKITRADVAKQAGNCAESLISNYYGTMDNFRRKIMREAVIRECLKIIAQGLVVGDKYAAKASTELKQKALASLC